jgi:hypothetical protein
VLAAVARYRGAPAGVLVFRVPAPSGSVADERRAYMSDPATCGVLLTQPV